MPRQSRRARSQSPAARKSADAAVPRHFSRRAETTPAAPLPDNEAAVAEPDIDSSIRAAAQVQRFRPPTATPARPSAVANARAARATVEANRHRLASTDYGYVVGELKRIFSLALLIVVLLVIVALIKR